MPPGVGGGVGVAPPPPVPPTPSPATGRRGSAGEQPSWLSRHPEVVPPDKIRLPRLKLPLGTSRLKLRSWRRSDAEWIAHELADREVTRTVPLWPRYTLSDARAFITRATKELRAGDSYLLAITERDSEEPVGSIGLEVRSARDRRGHLGYWIAHGQWGRGYASEAASALCQAAFLDLKLHRLETGVMDGNSASRAVLLRLGFRWEGRERDTWRVDGRYRDAERFALLAPEFVPYKPLGRQHSS